MNVCKKLLLVVLLASVPVVLVGMDESKEQIPFRVLLSGIMADLTLYKEKDTIAEDYPLDRIRKDLAGSRGELYDGIVNLILAGCTMDALFEEQAPGSEINFTEIYSAIIPKLEHPFINETDQLRVTKFLKKAFLSGKMSISQLKAAQLFRDPQELYCTLFYRLLSRVERKYYIYRYLIPSVSVCLLCTIAYKWWHVDQRDEDRQEDVDDGNDQEGSVSQEQKA